MNGRTHVTFVGMLAGNAPENSAHLGNSALHFLFCSLLFRRAPAAISPLHPSGHCFTVLQGFLTKPGGRDGVKHSKSRSLLPLLRKDGREVPEKRAVPKLEEDSSCLPLPDLFFTSRTSPRGNKPAPTMEWTSRLELRRCRRYYMIISSWLWFFSITFGMVSLAVH